ncbi:hypothetical protein PSTT_05607 [Puccinia striiformis]|uniref:SPX domain-containing protein n=1 Tax=Puccinia striiformis TaxID=27350 RepID=A0A2S4VN30_9BASI|nr:hypothetical protein PSTT_05607 [Puccinia striiformis]
MKFSHSLLFSTVPEWQSYYVSYDSLKATIYKLEKDQAAKHQSNLRLSSTSQNPVGIVEPADQSESSLQDNNESTGLLENHNDHQELPGPTSTAEHSSNNSHSLTPSDQIFLELLSQELTKVEQFYQTKQDELIDELNGLNEIETIEKQGIQLVQDSFNQSTRSNEEAVDDEDDDEEDEDEHDDDVGRGAQGGSSTRPRRRSRGSLKNPTGISKNLTTSNNSHLIDVNPSSSSTTVTQPPSSQLAFRASLDVHHRPPSGDTNLSRGIAKWLPNSPRPSRSLSLGSQTQFHRRAQQNLSTAPNLSELNFTAFRKILKKYDKVFESSLSYHFLEETLIHQSKAFNPTTISQLQAHLDSLFPIYARLITQGDEEMAKKQLNAHLREQVVWERNTIWRDMIGMERKGWANSNRTIIGKPFARTNNDNNDNPQSLMAIPPQPMGFQQAFKNLINPKFWIEILFNPSVFWCLVAMTGFIISMKYSKFESEPERNCLAMLVFVVVLWTSEALPLFVTGMFVPLLVIVLRVIRDKDNENQRMDSTHAAVFVFGQMFNPTIVLLLGAFTLAAVLSKHNIDKVMALNYSVGCNVAAPVLSYSLAQPILRTIPTRSPYTRSLILGIALAADIGGQASPIASPQNLIALSYMNPPPSWIVWFSIGIPISTLTIISTWAILTWSYEREFSYTNSSSFIKNRNGFNVEEEDPELNLLAPQSKFNQPIIYIKPIPNPKAPFSISQWFILFISFITILLWCFENFFHEFFGDMGVIALLPMIVFFGSGLLRKSDFDNFPWSIVFLAMSGIALGKSVLSSGLLNDMDIIIERVLTGLSLWPITIIFGFLVLIISTFISHTVASVLLIPIAFEIGNSMPVNHSRLLIFLTTFICSTGMGLPVSSFPNQTAVNLEDEFGTRYLSSKDFLKFGLLSSFFGFSIILIVGFLILLTFGY